jgi:Raf kinase inhibitor-like YbhB/YbcL family protein
MIHRLSIAPPHRVLFPLVLIAAPFVLAQTEAQAPPPAPTTPLTMTVEGFSDGGTIPLKYTAAAPGLARGDGISPAITWKNVPAGTRGFVLNMHDVDSVQKKGAEDQVHWFVWNIPADSTGLPEGVPKGGQLPDGTYQTSTSGPFYRPAGGRVTALPHHYIFELYALDTKIDMKPAADPFETRAEVLRGIEGHVLGKAVYVGVFRREP